MDTRTLQSPPLHPPSRRGLVALLTVTLVTSAGLLFWLQPMIAKFVLPLVGGVPAVWNTAMLFFQAALLGGYVYAHLLNRHLDRRRQTLVHLGLLAVCVLWLPIGVDTALPPPSDGNPSGWLLSVLAVGVGVPFVVVAGSAPLLQCWFAGSGHKDADNPYFLYAASNIGSMAALFGFPLLAEPLLDLPGQSLAWSTLFIALLLLTAASAWLSRGALETNPAVRISQHQPTPTSAPSLMRRFLWLLLVMASTSLMLGITTHLTTDVAAVPLLWVVPLALYLLTFIIVFARRPLVGSEGALRLLVFALVAYAILQFVGEAAFPWLVSAGVLLVVFFLVVLACHAQLESLKPAKAWLTEFYLWIAVGGVLGGAFNALAAPVLYQSAIEFQLMLAVSVALVLAARSQARNQSPRLMLAVALACAVVPSLAERAGWFITEGALLRERNYYGVLTVQDVPDTHTRMLTYGTTIHGVRDLSPGQDRVPSGYYRVQSPVYDVFAEVAARPVQGAIGAIGLGVGAISCHPTGGRPLSFYEINPAVTRTAENPAYFSFLSGCGADYRVVHGDGRLKVAEAPTGAFDLLFLDAFSSDSIPVHLLTREAFAVYFDKLAPGGILLIHITNRHLDLSPVVANIAQSLGLTAIERTVAAGAGGPGDKLNPRTQMVAVARRAPDFGALPDQPGWHALAKPNAARVWTDGYSNIIGALKVGR